MATLGSADLLVVPRFNGLSKQVDAALGAVDVSSSGSKLGTDAGKAMGGGLVKSGAVIGAASTVISKAMDAVASHVGDAVSRFDTLNQYPKTMELLGYSAEQSEASISKMSERLSSLPTRLDDMTSVVQGIVAVTGDLDQATDAGLALNDMLVASGSSTQLTTAAMEQFRQMLSKGKPEMEDWKSLTSAMPGQMQQLAEAMLGPTANANDLYTALGGGRAEATLSMDDLLSAMIRLDTEGGEGITSFKEQAETAAGGVQTAVSNMENAITKGLAGTLDAIGQDNISGLLGDMKDAVNEAFGAVNSAVGKAAPVVKQLYETVKPLAPALVSAAAGAAAFNAAGSRLSSLAGTGKKVYEAFQLVAGGAGTVSEGLELVGVAASPAALGLAAAGAAVGLLVGAYMDMAAEQEAVEKATTGLADVISDTTALDEYSGTLAEVGATAGTSAMSVEELTEAMGSHVDSMAETAQAASDEIAQLSTAQAVIDQCAGKSDLSAEAQGRLQWALKLVNDELGTNISATDVMNGSYQDANGEAQNLTESIGALIAKKKEEVRVEALSSNLSEAYEMQSDAAKTLAHAQTEYKAAVEDYVSRGYERGLAEDMALMGTEAGKSLKTAQEEYASATGAVSQLETELGDAAAAASDAATIFDSWGATTGPLFSAQLGESGTSLAALKEDLEALGVTQEGLDAMSQHDLTEIADVYDGTCASIVGKLDEWGVGMDESAATSARTAASIQESLAGMEGVGDALDGVGLNVSDLSQRLAEAGVSTQTLNEIGSANLSALASSCGGNMDAMVWFIQNYNSTPIIDKDGNVNLDDAQLMDAQGNLYTWNGSEFVDKSGTALMEDQTVMDAQGHLYTWNGSNLQYKSNTGQVFDLMSDGIAQRDEWNRTGLASYVASGTINIFRNITETVSRIFSGGGDQQARGGVQLHASGSVLRRQGSYIATAATWLDSGNIVGEDGAEAVLASRNGDRAIVPLTNTRYSQPFADVVGDAVARRMGAGADSGDIARAVASALSNMGVYINGSRLVGSITTDMDRSLGKVRRRSGLA